MKKIKYLLLVCLTMIAGMVTVNAAGFTVARSTKSVNIGNTVSITVNASGGAGWEYCVSYNQEVFKLVSANSDTGGACVKTGSTLTGYASVTYKFQAIKSGSSSFTVSGQMYNDSGEAIATDGATTTVEVSSAEEAYKKVEENTTNNVNLSSNANLRILEVVGYNLVPEFDKNKTEYTLDVDGSVDSVQVNAYREDTTSQITPIDIVNLTEGVNKVTVTVTAQKGNKKTYTILITKAEENPVKVTVDNKEYTVVNKDGALEVPAGYVSTTINIEGKEVLAYNNSQANITLVILKDSDSNMAYYIYKDGEFTPYKQISSSAITLVPVNPKETIKGYENTKTVTIGEKDITVYYKNDSDNIVLIYGVNTISGEESWYYYDIDDGTMLKYNDTSDTVEETKKINNNDKDYKILTLVFVCVSGLALLLIIILMIYVVRLKRKNNDLYNYMEKKIQKHRDKKFNNIGDKEIEKSELASFDDTLVTDDIIIEDNNNEEVEEVINDSEEDNSPKDIIEEVNEDVILDLDEDIEEKPKKKKGKKEDPTLISDTDILNNIAKANEESFEDDEPKKLSKKEEKLKKKREKELAKKAQREFLNDETFEESAFDLYERDETEIIPVVPKKKTKGRKKS